MVEHFSLRYYRLSFGTFRNREFYSGLDLFLSYSGPGKLVGQSY
jgi:hypothetical protein